MKHFALVCSFLLLGLFIWSCEDLIGLERLNIVRTEAIIGSNFIPEDSSIKAYVESVLIDVGDREPLIRYGHCWAKTPEPVIERDNFSENLSPQTPRVYTDTICQLDLDATYFIRSYVEFEGGITYGAAIEFIADASDVPVAEFGETLEIGTTLGGNGGEETTRDVEVSIELIAKGIRPIIAHGFCWSLDSLPTIENADTTNLGGLSMLGSISDTIPALTIDSAYFIRSYTLSSSRRVIYGGDGISPKRIF